MTFTENSIWVAKQLFDRNKVTGSAANLSFLQPHGDMVITRSGSCFGRLTPADFAVIDSEDHVLSITKPSKEWPLHRALYKARPEVRCVLHTHSVYSVLWSMLEHADPDDIIPALTPYLKMRVGKVGLVDYAPPGSQELFDLFRQAIPRSDGFILKQHGVVIGAADPLEAFYNLEELEESARIAWEVHIARQNASVKFNIHPPL